MDLASIGLKVDATQVSEGARELDKLTVSGKRAEQAVDQLGNQSVQTAGEMRGAASAASELAQRAQAAAAAATGQMRATEGMGKASGLASHHVQNLAFQANDMFVGLASGQKPMTVFMQQGTQIAQIMGQAGIGVGGLAKEVGGMVGRFVKAHPLMVALAAAAGVAAIAFQGFQKEIEKSKELETYAAGLGLTAKELKGLEDKGVTAIDVFKGLYKTFDDYLGLTDIFKEVKSVAVSAFDTMLTVAKGAAAGIYAGFVGGFRAVGMVVKSLPSVVGEGVIAAANLAISAVEAMVNKALLGLRKIVQFAAPMLQAVGMGGMVPNIGSVSFGRVGNPFAGSAANLAGNVQGAFSGAYSEAVSGLGQFGADIRANSIEAAKERLAKEAAKIIKDRTGPETKAAAGKAGKDAGAKLVEEFWKAVGDTQASNMADIIRANSARDKQLNEEAKRASDEMTDVLLKNADERIAKIDDEIAANKAWIGSLMMLVNQFDQLGGVGKSIGSFLSALGGFSQGNFGAVGGKVGVLLNGLFTNVDDKGNRSLNQIGVKFSDALDRVFGQNGKFFQALTGAGTGTAIGGILFGDNKGAQIGGAIGGAIGSFAGPIGNLVGSIIGSTIGAALRSAKFGSAVVGSGGVMAGGNNADSRSAANSAGTNVSSAISKIAEALGGSVGNYSVSIGETDGKWRISTTGRSGELKSKYSDVQVFGKGEAGYEAAMRAAIADAIKDGAITGVSEAVSRLLKGGTNIDDQVRKAQLFQGVFSALKAETDPLGAALENVTKEFDALRKIFDEAGASAAEYASLEELLALRRQKAVDEARRAKVDALADQFNLQIRALDLMGEGEKALAATRLFQLAGIKESLQPLQQLVFQLEDARAVIEKFGPLADDLRAYRTELLGGAQGPSLAAARSTFRSVAEAAANGDASALAKLRGVSGTYLEAMRNNASSALDYRRAFGEVLAGVDRGIFAADAQVEYAQLQIDAIKANSDILSAMRTELNTLQGQIVSNTTFMVNLWKRFEGDGLPIRTQDEPLAVEIVS